MSTTDSTPTNPADEPADTGRTDNSAGVAALVLGIVSVVFAANGWWLFLLPLAIATGVLAIVFGVRGRQASKEGRSTNAGQALAGLVLGVTALSVVAVGGIAWAVWGDEWDQWKDGRDTFDECIDDADDVEELEECIDDFPAEAEQLSR